MLAEAVTNAAKGTTPKDECTGGANASANAMEKKS